MITTHNSYVRAPRGGPVITLRGLVRPRLAIVLGGLLIGTTASSGWALDNPGGGTTVDCADIRTDNMCIECNPARGVIECCSLGPLPCTVINSPPTGPGPFTAGDITIKHGFSGLKLEFSRKEILRGDQLLVTFKLKGELRLPGRPTSRIDARGMLSGDDASVGSLAYAVGFIGGGEAALGQLQAQGKDLSLLLTSPPVTCEASLGIENCQVLAQEMAGQISAALPPGSTAQDLFHESIEPLGYTSCDAAPSATPTPSPTPSPTPTPHIIL